MKYSTAKTIIKLFRKEGRVNRLNKPKESKREGLFIRESNEREEMQNGLAKTQTPSPTGKQSPLPKRTELQQPHDKSTKGGEGGIAESLLLWDVIVREQLRYLSGEFVDADADEHESSSGSETHPSSTEKNMKLENDGGSVKNRRLSKDANDECEDYFYQNTRILRLQGNHLWLRHLLWSQSISQ
eukprot:TRINITY_DN5643_c0_g3_i1.p1 TRINITY_DN5643_c0_g3~~TRINITY_DN5643_c0_g3_i1.p1  ORF type:complete len:185 (+),score=11.34 TRINITY_DN5643_c0_g3_i1:475-1029(+)